MVVDVALIYYSSLVKTGLLALPHPRKDVLKYKVCQVMARTGKITVSQNVTCNMNSSDACAIDSDRTYGLTCEIFLRRVAAT
jgi:hypothetical protein